MTAAHALALLGYGVAAILAHELGHALVALTFGYRVRPRIDRHGVGVAIGQDDLEIPQVRAVLIHAAGPFFSLLLAAWALGAGELTLAGMSFELSVLNLLPFRASDGTKIRKAVSR